MAPGRVAFVGLNKVVKIQMMAMPPPTQASLQPLRRIPPSSTDVPMQGAVNMPTQPHESFGPGQTAHPPSGAAP